MERKLKVWSIAGAFITFVIAGGWHFLYSYFAQNGLTAAIAPVKESPWEHAKLFFVPAIIWYVILYFIAGKKFPNFVFSHALALVIMPAAMLGLFYLYTLFIPDNLTADIIESFIVVALGQFIAYKLTTSRLKLSGPKFAVASVVIVLALLAVYIYFTYNPPHCGMFFDETHMRYGI